MDTLFCARGEGTCILPSGGCIPPFPLLAHVWPYCKMDCLQYVQKAICPTAKWTDCRMSLLQYGLTAICLYCNMATAIWPTAIWRRQNDAQPKGRGEGGWKSFSFHYCDIYTWNFVASNLCVLPCYLPFLFPSNEVCQPTTIMTCTWR